MTNIGRPKELIKIASQNELIGSKRIPFYRRPKVLAYAAALILMILAGSIRISGRDSVALTIIRAPGPAYTQMPDGRYGNMFIIRATNNTSLPVKLDLEVFQPDGAQILCAQCQSDVAASEELRASAIVTFDHKSANQTVIIRNRSTDTTGSSMLLGPK